MFRTSWLRPVALSLTGVLFAVHAWAEGDKKPNETKATFLLTGLHCPPCTGTVQGTLTRANGVKGAKVDWRTKAARVEFDESVLPAQVLANTIAATPHMMGGRMRYAGWLALKAPSVTDEASGQLLKDALAKVEGIKSVAAYPEQRAVAVQFATEGKLTSQQVIDALAKAGIQASNY